MDRPACAVEELAAACREFAEMQHQHAALLAEGCLKNLPEWNSRRERAFLRLQQCFSRFDAARLDGRSEGAVQLRQMMEAIINDERSLKLQVQSQLAEMREKLHILRRGKGVLKGYSLNHGPAQKPRFLSNKA